MFLESVRTEVSQGDIFPSIAVGDHEVSGTFPAERTPRVMVVSHDCEYDKLAVGAAAEHCLVVEVRSPEDAPGGLWGSIKSGRVWNALHVPEGANHAAGFLDYRRMYRVRKDRLEAAKDERVASLSAEGQRSIVYGLAAFLLHEKVVISAEGEGAATEAKGDPTPGTEDG